MEKIRNWASNNRKLFIICVVILLVLVVVLIKGISYYANKPDSISAEYVGTISDNYTCNEDDFKVVAHYNDGSKKSIQDFDISQSHPIRVGEKSTATITYYGRKTKVDIDASSVMNSDNEVQMNCANIKRLVEDNLSKKMNRNVVFTGDDYPEVKLGKHLKVGLEFWKERNGKELPLFDEKKIPDQVDLYVKNIDKQTKQEQYDAQLALTTFAYTVQNRDSYKKVMSEVGDLAQQLSKDEKNGDLEEDGFTLNASEDGYIGDISSSLEITFSDAAYLYLSMEED